eukprot:CAMPEP_0116122158 /NCGR_PEP_ID=MMETSP0329-20121206/4068_1 /TAXON_ID=697910 /ORGANISM="Pseudo-nitzschia arenysensis, Strain B593" /LENGTH=284 /DNA_ID=CAMNT_0003615993 /DNA_START=64 /DNA_END=918 /DNA_ORIENTATION=+
MIVISQNTQDTTDTILKRMPENRPTVESGDDDSCTSRDEKQGHLAKRAIQCGKTTKESVDNSLLRQTTASIADALLRLGGSDDGSDSSSCENMIKKRKRVVSLAAEADACSTNSQSTETDNDSQSSVKHTNKRLRKASPPSTVVCSPPSKLSKSSKQATHDLRTRMKLKSFNNFENENALSFSTSEFQITPCKKLPGDLGCISQLFHRDFRPLSAAPQLPREIVPEDHPHMPSMRSPYAPAVPQGTMYSTAITEHNDCLIMHSYTVLPRMSPSHMALAQLANGM